MLLTQGARVQSLIGNWIPHATIKSSPAATKTWCSQINKYLKERKKERSKTDILKKTKRDLPLAIQWLRLCFHCGGEVQELWYHMLHSQTKKRQRHRKGETDGQISEN